MVQILWDHPVRIHENPGLMGAPGSAYYNPIVTSALRWTRITMTGAAFGLAGLPPHCRFDGEICTVSQESLVVKTHRNQAVSSVVLPMNR